MNEPKSPERLAKEVLSTLAAVGDPGGASQSSRFFKPAEKVRFFGIRTPDLRKLVAASYNAVKRHWGLSQAIEFCAVMISKPQLESKAFGVLMLARFHRSFEKSLLLQVQAWPAAGHVNNWATTDALATVVVTPLLQAFPELVQDLADWRRSKNLWIRRTAVVAFVPIARKGVQLDIAYQTVVDLLDDAEDLIQKATGWLLREAGKTDPGRLEKFLLRHGSRASRTTVRYAIERFPKQKRGQLLSETRTK